ncbi:MAG: CRISPR-associated endonuclease Cas1/CRISPR-associated protein Cas4 [Planctomycetaceae bacterium]|nr:CRISPR-associated endonuclease Cas1/CRISPR-associated protein Cas4 [Planctomycetaceae bacterium]
MDTNLTTLTSTDLEILDPHEVATSPMMSSAAQQSEKAAVLTTLPNGEDVFRSESEKLNTEAPTPIIPAAEEELPLRVMSLHALLYCERLFYLEEVEEIRMADAAVYAGRRLHDDLQPLDDESPETRRCDVASDRWGLLGVVDAVRRRDGHWVAYEHKRGRCRRDDKNQSQAWPSDRIQAIAYAVLLEESLAEAVPQARIRYHADNVTVFLVIDQAARDDLAAAITRARELRRTTLRPPVTPIEALCKRCSLAPVCLPEEERLVEAEETRVAPTLFPSNRERTTLHVVSSKSYISRSGDRLTVTTEGEKQTVPIQDIDSVVIHGFGQMTTQAIHLCAYHGISVQWMTAGGKFSAGTTSSPGRVQHLWSFAPTIRVSGTVIECKQSATIMDCPVADWCERLNIAKRLPAKD